MAISNGSAHLPADRLRAPKALTDVGIDDLSFVTDALSLLPEEPDHAPSPPAADPAQHLSQQPAHNPTSAFVGARILLVDDNADMREYVVRLLRPHSHWSSWSSWSSCSSLDSRCPISACP
ncbi:MAG: hypothetical protein LH479_09660 [Polaromonas sp.]|nr:hypothetical protein [Polaromonas sp.]